MREELSTLARKLINEGLAQLRRKNPRFRNYSMRGLKMAIGWLVVG